MKSSIPPVHWDLPALPVKIQNQRTVPFIPRLYCNSFAIANSFCGKRSFQPGPAAPSPSRNGRLETKAADDLFENSVVLRMRRELCRDFDAPALLEVGAIEPPQAELAVAGALQQQGADMSLFRTSADHPDAIMEVGFGLRDRLPVDDPNQRPQRQIDENDKAGRQSRVQRMAASRQQARSRRAPQRGCGIEAGNLKPLAKDDSRTQEADPRHNLGGHPRRASVVGKQTFEDP